MRSTAAAPKIGRVYELAERDYKYGEGPLMARIVGVLRKTIFDDEPWWEVKAFTTWGTSMEHGDMDAERYLYIREQALTAGPLP